MRFLRPAMAALLLSVSAPALIAPSFGQECTCPPAGGVGAAAVTSGPVIEADQPPPPLPEYDQPPMPAPGYYWTPGYWAWNNDDYYWVPGVWVEPPQLGLLWTPGYWAFVGGVYLFHRGYWAPQIGFYGGVDYGYGYNGLGYEGGRWENGRFFYNTTVNNFGGVRVTNVYGQPVTVPPGGGRASYNGGPGGNLLKPTPEQERLVTEQHIPPTPAQKVRSARPASTPSSSIPPIRASRRSPQRRVPASSRGRAWSRQKPPARLKSPRRRGRTRRRRRRPRKSSRPGRSRPRPGSR